MFGVMNHLDIQVCQDAEQASEMGFNYSSEEYTAVEIQTVVVVREGTEGGNHTVDIILHDAHGNKYVCMVTGNLIKSIPC